MGGNTDERLFACIRGTLQWTNELEIDKAHVREFVAHIQGIVDLIKCSKWDNGTNDCGNTNVLY